MPPPAGARRHAPSHGPPPCQPAQPAPAPPLKRASAPVVAPAPAKAVESSITEAACTPGTHTRAGSDQAGAFCAATLASPLLPGRCCSPHPRSGLDPSGMPRDVASPPPCPRSNPRPCSQSTPSPLLPPPTSSSSSLPQMQLTCVPSGMAAAAAAAPRAACAALHQVVLHQAGTQEEGLGLTHVRLPHLRTQTRAQGSEGWLQHRKHAAITIPPGPKSPPPPPPPHTHTQHHSKQPQQAPSSAPALCRESVAAILQSS